MADNFKYDVFLSHSSMDKAVVLDVAERLRADKLRVWFDDWELRPGDSIPAKIEEGLEHSRILILFMSSHAFGSDWAKLESNTFRFRDPLNKERRFIPLRLDNAPLKGSLTQFLYINWLPDSRKLEYLKLLEACRPPATHPTSEQETARARFEEKIRSLGHTNWVQSIAFSPDGRRALSGSRDMTLRVWDVKTGYCLKVLEGHSDSVSSVAWSPDGHHVLSGSDDKTVRLWEVDSTRCVRVFDGHFKSVNCVAWSSDGHLALSGSDDKTVQVWEIKSSRCLKVFEGHSESVRSVAWSPDGRLALSGSDDKTARVWEITSGHCLRTLKGHSESIRCVAWSPDGRLALSGSEDETIRVWEIESGRFLRAFEGHSNFVSSVAWSPNGRKALSGSEDQTVRVWEIESGHCLIVINGHSDSVRSIAWSPEGRRVLSGSNDTTVRVWEIDTGRRLKTIEGHSGSVRSIAWSPEDRRAVSGSEDDTIRIWTVESGHCQKVLRGHSNSVNCVAWSPDGRRVLSGSEDNAVLVWPAYGRYRDYIAFEGHFGPVNSVAWSPNGRLALSGSRDKTIRVWMIEGGCLAILEGHSESIRSVAWIPVGRLVVSGSDDKTVRIWDVEKSRCLRALEGHSNFVNSVACSPDGHYVLSGSGDRTLRLWKVDSGRCLRVLEGHSDSVRSVAWSPDGRYVLSGSDDKTVRVWEVESGRCLRILEGHYDSVNSVSWSKNGGLVFSGAQNGVIRTWNLSDLTTVLTAESRIPRIDAEVPKQLQYTNAKVLLVGESGSGKTGLSKRLALNVWQPSDSTVGAWATQWKLPVSSRQGLDDRVEREIWLWDFGGQADQRLIHQLYMEDTALAILVFDGQKEHLFETLGQWDRDLTRASQHSFTKLLVAGRVDTGGVRVSQVQIDAFVKEREYARFLETSAKQNIGCEELKQAILNGIQWENIPWRSSPLLFKRLKDEIIRLKDEGRALMRFKELREMLQLRLLDQSSSGIAHFSDAELKAVVSLLAGPGIVWEIKFGSWVLLQPERINAYAQAVIQTMREDQFERGCIPEQRVLKGDLIYHSSIERLDIDEERFVLLAMHQTLIERSLCLREQTDQGALLVFPSYHRRERPDLVGHPSVLVSYRFNGFLDDIYATLVVRLHHTSSFKQDELWRYAADFKTLSGKQLGVKLNRRAEGAGELEVYFDPAISMEEKIIFSKYVHEHLLQNASDVIRLRHYVCPHCDTPVGNHQVAMKKLEEGKKDILCINCDDISKRILLWDQLEELFASPEMKQQVRELQEQSSFKINNESKERALVGEVISTIALAGQLSREYTVSDHGIDMEIEFMSDDDEATGQKLYLQLKSGDSHTHRRKGDGVEIFPIKHQRHARYWMAQAFPVLLVIRNSNGEARWMEVRDYLIRESDSGKKSVNQIVFEGERFDVVSVRRWRDRILRQH